MWHGRRAAAWPALLVAITLVTTSCVGARQPAGRAPAEVGAAASIATLLQPHVAPYSLRAQMTVATLRTPTQANGPTTTYRVRAVAFGRRLEVTRTGGGSVRLWLGDGSLVGRERAAPGQASSAATATALEPAYFPHLAPLAGWATEWPWRSSPRRRG